MNPVTASTQHITAISLLKNSRVALVRTDVSEELSASFIRVTKFGELGTTLAVTSNRRTLRRNTKYCCFVCTDMSQCQLVCQAEFQLRRKATVR
jgi:hypothetical protein